MPQRRSIFSPVLRFWQNRTQRLMVMSAIMAVSLLVLAFGAFNVLAAQNEMNELEGDQDTIEQQIAVFESKYPQVERNGEMVHDLSGASQGDLQVIMLLRGEKRQLEQAHADAENDRAAGYRTGVYGLLGLAFGVLVAPEGLKRHKRPAPDPPDTQ